MAPPPRRVSRPVMMGDFYVGRTGVFLTSITTVSTMTTTRTIIGPRGQPIQITTQETVTSVEDSLIRVPAGSRQFKIADNESPAPQDRVFFTFNYFDDFGGAVNRRFGVDSDYREARGVVGFERTVLCGDGSIGMRVPFHRLDGSSDVLTLDNTDFGDVSIILKYAAYRDLCTGDTISLGLAVTTPTGDGQNNLFHGVVLQPYVGYLWNWGNWYVHGFSSIDAPAESGDATLLFNDMGVGYQLYEADETCDGLITGLIPTFEVHVNTPLNHRGALDANDPAGTSDTVNLTLGTIVELRRRARLAVGAIVPVTGPRPFDFEVAATLNWYF
jgi:hypothetical protein